MRNEPYCGAAAVPERARGVRCVALVLLLALGACVALPRQDVPPAGPASSASAVQATAQPAPAPVPVLPFDEAVLGAADALFSGAALPEPGPSGRHPLVIDPLIDGATGFQSAATRSMQSRIVELARAKYPRFEVREFTTASVAEAPLVLVGSLAGIDKAGKVRLAPEAYRIWLVLADLKSGRIVGKGTARAAVGGVDVTPTPFFGESPAWAKDRYVEAYLATCGGKVGDPIDPAYIDGILAAATIGDATEAYDAGRFREALALYESAAGTPAGDQLRVHNGLYLANRRLGRRVEAEAAFDRLVDYGLRGNALAVRFLFKPATTLFWPPELAETYPMWLERIARRAAQRDACLKVVGHTSPSGSAAVNDRLSLLRADHVASRLRALEPRLDGRLVADGAGSRENVVGTGADDVTDALDRRVEFKTFRC